MSANEELMSVNEELQSTNEELQSTNEELETSKEELQALNEELLTVNAELSDKVEELNQATSDMENLLSSTEIATIFLDRSLNIKRFTPAITGLFDMISADIGRPFRRLAGNINWPTFSQDVEAVLTGRSIVEREVMCQDNGAVLPETGPSLPDGGGENRRYCRHLHQHHRAQVRRGGYSASCRGTASPQ